MRTYYGGAVPKAAEINRHEMQATDTFVSGSSRVQKINGERITFGDLARFACPKKTDAWLAHIAKCDVRTAQRWLSGQNEPPAEAFGAIMFEIMRRYQQPQEGT